MSTPRLLVLATLLVALATMSHAQDVRRCADCGQIVLEESLEADGRYFHPEHFRCDYCKKPIDGTYAPVEDKFYHRECYVKQFVVVCFVCNKPLQEEYRLDYWGNASHASHQDETPSCDFCRRYIVGGFGAGSAELPDGRRLCGVCAATSVTTVEKVQELLPVIVTSLEGHAIRVSSEGIPLLLVGSDRMKMLTSGGGHVLAGFTDYSLTPTESDAPDIRAFNVSLLYGMPELEMAYTVAHELMHVWMFRNDVPQHDLPWVEGSCQYASYLVMKDVGTKESAFIMQQIESATDSTYGGGFRRVKGFVDENGVDAWLSALTSRTGE